MMGMFSMVDRSQSSIGSIDLDGTGRFRVIVLA